jgi:hypothetical protein
MSLITNKLVTRGLGTSRGGVAGRAGMITQGYGGVPVIVVATTVLPLQPKGGGSDRRRREDEALFARYNVIVMQTTLVEINGMPPPQSINGTLRLDGNNETPRLKTIVEHVDTRAQSIWDRIKISVRRLR